MQPHGLDLEELREEGISWELLEENGASSAEVHPWKGLWKWSGIEILEKELIHHTWQISLLSLEMMERFP